MAGLVRFVDWYIGLGWREKIVVAVVAAAGVFLASFLVAMAVLPFLTGPQEDAPQQGANETATPAVSAEATSSDPDINMEVTDVRWVGERAVAEGRWWGDTDISSVHCDLFEGNEETQRSTRWWDRSVATSMDWSRRTFSQDFVAAEGADTEEQIDPASEYSVTCSAYFSGGWSMATTRPVEGAPPG